MGDLHDSFTNDGQCREKGKQGFTWTNGLSCDERAPCRALRAGWDKSLNTRRGESRRRLE